MQSLTKELVKFALETDFNDIPEKAKHEAKRIFLDSMGCALAGTTVDKGKLSIQFARGLGDAAESTIVGTGDRVSSPAAAFANGELINATDMDCILAPAHVTPYVLSAPLALGETRKASGKDLIVAIALSHEISTRIGKALRETIFNREGKFKQSEVNGFNSAILGGAIGAGKMARLNDEGMLHAIGLAGHMTPVPAEVKWRMTVPSGMDKYGPAGWISLAEVTAVLLAQMGYTGDTTVLDGDYGFWKFYGAKAWRPDMVVQELGDTWHFVETSYKPYPCCRLYHGALDCFIEIIEENHLIPKDIERISTLLNPMINVPVWRNTQVTTHIDTQFNVPYAFAVAAHRIPVADWQDPDTMNNPEIVEFMKRISFSPHPDFGKVWLQNPQNCLASVEVAAKGRTFKKEKIWCKGDHFSEEARINDDDLEAKFRMNAAKVLSQNRIDKAVEAIFELENVPDMAELLPGFCS